MKPSICCRCQQHQTEVKAAPPTSSEWLRLAQVLDKTKTGKTWVYERMKDKDDPFPAGVRLSARRLTVWNAAEVSAWMERRTTRPDAITT